MGPLTPSQWRAVAVMAAVVVGLHAIGFFLLIVVARHSYGVGASGVFAAGTGVTAYTLGLRHAFDADHISAISRAAATAAHVGRQRARNRRETFSRVGLHKPRARHPPWLAHRSVLHRGAALRADDPRARSRAGHPPATLLPKPSRRRRSRSRRTRHQRRGR